MERLRVTRTHADGTVLRCAYHGLKAGRYHTPFHRRGVDVPVRDRNSWLAIGDWLLPYTSSSPKADR